MNDTGISFANRLTNGHPLRRVSPSAIGNQSSGQLYERLHSLEQRCKPTGMTKSTTNKSSASRAGTDAKSELKQLPLSQLHFDPRNPRFAGEGGDDDDSQVLERVVRVFGVEDVISSIAVNGYMDTEPLVGIELPDDGGVRVIEGNRRLAALLILADDPRAKNRAELRQSHPLGQGALIDPVPVVVYGQGTEPKQLLPYLGVRHIVGSRAWDSYAKAAWIAKMLETHGNGVSLRDIEEMTGDTRGTISRLLEGYYLVRQLVDEKLFIPKESYPKGRGSAVEFPFSWVYNALGYQNIKKTWLGMTKDQVRPKPVPKKHLEQASELMVFMFGRKSSKTPRAIAESRELGDLAVCLGDEKMVAQLRNGKMVKDVIWSSKSGLERVLQSLAKADDGISDALGSVDELTFDEIDHVEPEANKVRKKAKSLYDKLLDQKKAADE